MTTTRIPESADSVPAAGASPLGRIVPWLYVVGGAIGLLSSFGLTIEKIEKLANPSYVPTCSFNPVVSCGSVMDSWQGSLFGFPNPLIGIAAFSVVVTAGVVLLTGFAAPRWFWLGLQAGTTLGVIFVHWLIFQSLYSIHALCPYCMVVWAVTIPIFWYTTLHNLDRGHLGTSGGRVLVQFHSLVVVLWYLVIVGLILQAFWTYWTSLL